MKLNSFFKYMNQNHRLRCCVASLGIVIGSLASAATSTQTVSLNSGWNLVGNGLTEPIGVNSSLGNASLVTTVWKWNVSSSKWAFYAPSLPDGGAAYAAAKGYDFLTTIYGGEGFWVNASQPFSLTLEAAPQKLSSTFQEGKPGALRSGWNLVSVGDTLSARVFNASLGLTPPSAGAVAQNLTSLWAWDSTQGKWFFYAPQLDASGGSALKDYATAKGYLDFTTQSKNLGSGVGFWVNYPSSSEMDTIEPVLKAMMADWSSCTTSAKQHAATLVQGAYMGGKPVAAWIDEICSYGLGTIEPKNPRLVGLAGDKAIVVFTFSSNAHVGEIAFGFQKVNGTWKLLGVDAASPMDDPNVRHAFTLNLDSARSSKALFQFERYVDFWTNRSHFPNASMPASIEVFVIGADDAGTKWSTSAFPSTPDLILYPAPSNCSNLYTLDANKKDCNSFAYDSLYPSLFSKLESNTYSLALYKFKDANGNCFSCEASTGLPISGAVLGNAKTATQIFGSSVTAAQLSTSAGIAPTALSSEVKTNARRYFGMPSDTQLDTLSNALMSTNLSKTLTVPWNKPTKFNNPIDGVWGGTMACGTNNSWVNTEDVQVGLVDTSYVLNYNNPSSKNFNNASYVSITLANKKDLSEYAFYINANRNNICTN